MTEKQTISILARTNRALLPFEQALSAANIPFYYVNKSGFFNQTEIQLTLAYLGASLFPANYLISGMLRGDLHPTKFLPRTRISAKLKELKAEDEDASYWAILTKEPQRLVEPRNLEAVRNFTQFVHSLSRYRDLSAADALKQLFGALRIGDHFSEMEYADSDPLENLAALSKMASKYGSIKEFLDFCRRVAAASKKKTGVALSTCHSFKGMEADTVYLVQCSEGIIPHSKATDLDGERNVFFVGCSRPRRELVISYSGTPSVFLAPFIKKEKADVQA